MELLRKLTEIDSPSGHENNICDFIKNEAVSLGYDVSVDSLGSIIAHKKGSGKKLMIAAHTDEIGIIVNYVDDNGFIKFGAVGGLDTKELMKRRVRFQNGTIGIISAEEKSFEEKAELGKMYIDIGAKDRDEALKQVSVGDMAVFCGDFYQNGNIVVSKALDDRAGCYIMLKAMAQISDSKNDLYFVFTAQEEVGLRGGRTSAFSVMPDIGIAIDVTDVGDTPDAAKSDVKIGGGAAIKVMDRSVLCDRGVVNTLKDLAQEHKIPYTSEIMTDGGTDAGAMALTGAGVKTGGISIPVRYIHSPSELASISDINDCVRLLKTACEFEW